MTVDQAPAPSAETLDRLTRLGTATLGESAPAVRILDRGIRPLRPEMTMAGAAHTVRCRPGDNLALHRAIAALAAGEVLVVDYGGSLESGPFGEILALACQLNGGRGLVIDGAVRDSARIAAMGFPVFARGRAIPGTSKRDPGAVQMPVQVGGVSVAPGDIVIADADAVIVLPAADLGDGLARAQAREAAEADAMRRLRAGETTLTIFGLDE